MNSRVEKLQRLRKSVKLYCNDYQGCVKSMEECSRCAAHILFNLMLKEIDEDGN